MNTPIFVLFSLFFSFDKYLLSTYHAFSTVLGTKNIAVNKGIIFVFINSG